MQPSHRWTWVSGLLLTVGCSVSGAEEPTSPATDSAGVSVSHAASYADGIEFANGGTRTSKTDAQQFFFAATKEVRWRGEPLLELAVSYDRLEFSWDEQAGRLRPALPKTLQRLAVEVAAGLPLTEKWTLEGSLGAGWAQAGTTFSSDGAFIAGSLYATYVYSPTLSLSAGAAFDSLARSSRRVSPLLAFTWDIVPDQWVLSFGFPTTGLTYIVSPRLAIGLDVSGQGGTYYVEKDPGPSSQGRPVLNDAKLEFTDFRLGLNVKYDFTEAFTASLALGALLEAKARYDGPYYKLESEKVSPFVGGSLVYKF